MQRVGSCLLPLTLATRAPSAASTTVFPELPALNGFLNATKTEDVELVQWGPETENAFQAIKGALALALALGLPDYSNTF